LEDYKKVFNKLFVPSFGLFLFLIVAIIYTDKIFFNIGNPFIFYVISTIFILPIIIITAKINSQNKKIFIAQIIILVISTIISYKIISNKIYTTYSNPKSIISFEMPLKIKINSIKKYPVKQIIRGSITKNKKIYKIYLTYYGEKKLNNNDSIITNCKLKRIHLKNSFSKYLIRRGFYFTGYLYNENLLLVRRTDTPISFKEKIKKSLMNKINVLFNDKPKFMVIALLFANKNFLSKKILKNFKRAGVLHTISASGFHVGIIAVIPFLIFSLFGIKKRHSIIAVLTFILAYVFLTEMPISLVRAAIMFLVISLSIILYHETNSTNALFITGILILLYSPIQLFNIGFQLTVGATAGILIFFQAFKKIYAPFPSFIKNSLAVTISAQIFAIPIILINFHEINFSGIISNLLVVPLIAFFFSSSLLVLFVSYFSIAIAQIFYILPLYSYKLINKTVIFFSQIDGHFWISKINSLFFLPLIFIVFLTIPFFTKKKNTWAISLILIGISWISFISQNSKNSLILFRYNKEKIFLEQNKNRGVITGDLSNIKNYKKIIDYLKSSKIEKLSIKINNTNFKNIQRYSTFIEKLQVNKCAISGEFLFSKYLKNFLLLTKKNKIKLKLLPEEVDIKNKSLANSFKKFKNCKSNLKIINLE